MKNIVSSDFFTQQEVAEIKSCIQDQLETREHVLWDVEIDTSTYKKDIVKIQSEQLGRLTINGLNFPSHILDKVTKYVLDNNELSDKAELVGGGVTYGEYGGKYGMPRLQPHLDGGTCGIILDYQLESNVVWPIGIEYDTVELKDNEAMILYPLTQYHWRPVRKFAEDEYVKMIFFEFHTEGITRKRDEEKESALHQFSNNFYKGDNK
jgi:hypothetical protein